MSFKKQKMKRSQTIDTNRDPAEELPSEDARLADGESAGLESEVKPRKYRFSDFVEKTGVSRDMVKYYLRARLLPKPHKVRANLSLYTEDHVKLVQLILKFQEQTKLSLSEVASVFKAAKHNPNTIEIELLSAKYQRTQWENIIPFQAHEAEIPSGLELPKEFIKELVDSELLDEKYAFEEEGRNKAGLLWALSHEGISLDFFQKAKPLIAELAELEVKALLASRRPETDFEVAAEQVTMVDRMINRWVINEKTEHARHRYEKVLSNSEKALSNIHDAIYVPSQVFCARHKVAEELLVLQSKQLKKPKDLKLLHHLCMFNLLLADYENTMKAADKILAVYPNDGLALASKSLAYGMNNDLKQALIYSGRLKEANFKHPIGMLAQLFVLLMQAAKLGGIADNAQLLKEAVDLFLELPALEPEDNYEQLETWLLLGSANTLFPDALNSSEEAIAGLEKMIGFVELKTSEQLNIPAESLRFVYQVYAYFFLGLLESGKGNDEKAQACFEKVIQLDPMSNFGQFAYLKMSS